MHASTQPLSTTRRSPLLAFALLSLALHSLLLLNVEKMPPPALGDGTLPTLSVALQPAAAATPPPQPVIRQVRQRTAARTVIPTPVVATTPQAAPTPIQQFHEESTPATSTAGNEQASAAAVEQRLLGRVHSELLRYFRYPPLAVRNGWQGTVLLGFRINRQGDIEAIHVARSSGHSALDRAAVGALSQVRRLLLDTGSLSGTLDLQLPVIYRLEES